MAIYASADELVVPASPPRTNRWTVTIILTAFLSLIYFLQSEEATDRLVALQHVVVKNKSIRGIANMTGLSFENAMNDDEFQWNDDDDAEEADEAPVDDTPEPNDTVNEVKTVKEPSKAENEAKKDTTDENAPQQAEGTDDGDAHADGAKDGSDQGKEETKATKDNEQKEDSGEILIEKKDSGDDSKKEDKEDDKGEVKVIKEDESKEEAKDAENGDETDSKNEDKESDKESTVIKEDETKEEPKAANKEDSANDNNKDESDECASKCSSRAQQHKERWNGDLLNTNDVERLAQEAYDKLIARLKVEYGVEYFAKIFQVDGKSRGRSAFLSANADGDVSLKRLKRKLKMKILAAQLSIQEELESFGDCDCKAVAKVSNRRIFEIDNDISPLADYHERFVWATGGHSSAAGHGNLFNESYTAVMERGVADVFGSIGIEFEGRNYAMGGTDSAPEIALCGEAIFGTDVDIISYDHCMLDGREWDKKGMYANRGAGLNPGRPVIVDMFIDKFVERRVEEIQKIEDRGLAGLYLATDTFKEMKEAIPDTFGLTMEQIEALPPNVRHFKCQDALEKGDPTCGDKKFDNDMVCPDRHFMNSWHPGWRMNALYGNTMALFLIETLLDSISEIGSISDRERLLRHLQTEENVDYQKFANSDVPPLEKDFLRQIGDELLNETGTSVFYRSPSICHTGRLPSQTRYMGILTESDETGVHDYFKGIPRNEAEKLEKSDEMEMPLVYDPNDHNRQTCEVELNRDVKDYFFASSKMGWTTMTIPNKAEKEAYGRDTEYLGILVMCLKYW